jgi:hypothetical protein
VHSSHASFHEEIRPLALLDEPPASAPAPRRRALPVSVMASLIAALVLVLGLLLI